MITKKELKILLSNLENAVDRFIVAGFYYGLNCSSDNREGLLNLKVDCVDFENSTIKLSNGYLVKMDSLLKKITSEAINQKIYIKLGNVGNSSEDYSFNESNEYIVKSKPNKRNNYGLEPLTNEGLKTRIRSISEFLGMGSTLNASYLKQSGIYNMLKEENRVWRTCDAERFLKENNTSLRRNMLIQMLKDINGGN